MPWLRRVEIIVSRKDDPSVRTVFSDHRIDFEVKSEVGWPADTADITLYNLSLEEVKLLQNKSFGELYIEIRAGYKPEGEDRAGQNGGYQNYIDLKSNDSEKRIEILGTNATIFSGVITNCVGFRRPPEHVTQLFCISKAFGVATDFKQMKAIPKGATLRDAIQSMCSDYGFGTISTFGVSGTAMSSILRNGRTFHDTFLVEFRKLLGEYNMNFSMTTGEIQIFPETFADKDAVNRMSKDREPIKLDVNSVIGNPIAGICTYTLTTFLNSSVQPGMILDVSLLVGNELLANGVTSVTGEGIVLNTDSSIFRWAMEDKYFITNVVHRGSTHTMEYQTVIVSALGGNSAMGQKEIQWQQMYANSGMSMESY